MADSVKKLGSASSKKSLHKKHSNTTSETSENNTKSPENGAWVKPSFVALSAAKSDSERLEFIHNLDTFLQTANMDFNENKTARTDKVHNEVAKFMKHFGPTLSVTVRQCVSSMDDLKAQSCEQLCGMLNDISAFVWANQKEKLPNKTTKNGLIELINLNSAAGVGLLQAVMHPNSKPELAAPVLQGSSGNLATLIKCVEHGCHKKDGDLVECQCAEEFGPLHAAAEVALLVAASRHCPDSLKQYFDTLSKHYNNCCNLQFIICLNQLYPKTVNKPIEQMLPFLLRIATHVKQKGPALFIMAPAALTDCSVLSLHLVLEIAKNTPNAFNTTKCENAAMKLESVFIAGEQPSASMALEVIKVLVCNDAKRHYGDCKFDIYYETACKQFLPPRSLQTVTDILIQNVVQDTSSAKECVDIMARILKTPAFPVNGKIYILQAWTELADREKQANILKRSTLAKASLKELCDGEQKNELISTLSSDLVAVFDGVRPKSMPRAKSAGEQSLLFKDQQAISDNSVETVKIQSQSCNIL